MADYDFTGLSPHDFESLCGDLISESKKLTLQAFTTGRDGGIDLRCARVKTRNCIVQCKHFARSSYSGLKSAVKKELPKLRKLSPNRYILATSVGLTPQNVDELFGLLQPFCKSVHDIIGRDDLNTLLRRYAHIEKRHLKLWLTSAAVLSRALNNDVFIQSAMTEDAIRRKLGLYVYTSSFDKARERLNKHRVCVLSGVPGVGKTSLAEMLLMEYMAKGWQIVSVRRDIAEALKVFSLDQNVKQIFYYDDFLGQISVGEKLSKNEDRMLVQFMESIARSSKKRFILTTREYILAQAKAMHEQLSRSQIDIYRFVVECSAYGKLDKAKILANHLYFSGVPQSHIRAIVDDRGYDSILDHEHYSPRIVEWMTQASEVNATPASKYRGVFLEKLDKPTNLWLHAFQRQLSNASRDLLLVLASYMEIVSLVDFRRTFEVFHAVRAARFHFSTQSSDFENALDELEGNFIRIDRHGELTIAFHNPSIRSFVRDQLLQTAGVGCELVETACHFEQVEQLLDSRVQGESVECAASTIAKAVSRTLKEAAARMWRHQGVFHRESSSIWKRLQVCERIARASGSGELTALVESEISVAVSMRNCNPGPLAEIEDLLDQVEANERFSKELVNTWRSVVWAELLALEEDSGETLDGLVDSMRWYLRNRDQYDTNEAAAVMRNLVSAVKNEVVSAVKSRDANELGGTLELVEIVQSELGQSFSAEIDRLNEAIDKYSDREPDYDDDWHEESRETGTHSISSVFDALLE